MNTETKPAGPRPQPEDLQSMKTLEELIAEQGVAQTATFDRLLGSGSGLWADDVEFDIFLKHMQATRHEKG